MSYLQRVFCVATGLLLGSPFMLACSDSKENGTQTSGTGSGGSGQALGGSSAQGASGGQVAGASSGSGGFAGSSGGAGSGGAGSGGASSGGSSGAGGGGAGGMNSGGTAGGPGCALPANFKWKAGAPIILPQSDQAHELVAVKDPTVVRYNDLWHVYASSVTTTGVYNMVYTSFADWADAASAPLYYMDQTPGFDRYAAAPQLFYFSPQNKWYLVFQSGPPMYATADDPGDPTGWSSPQWFYSTEPEIITQNDGWLDFWVICDSAYCHLFFSDDHGRWYKSKTSVADFPNGFDEPVVVMEDAEAGRLFEGSSVYKVAGANGYLALIEAFDSTSNWRRYFRSFTAPSLEGPWQPLRDSGAAPFVGPANVSFEGAPWTNDISHGELVRASYDESSTIDPCSLEFIYQGFDPAADTTEYNSIPWKLGLLGAQ